MYTGFNSSLVNICRYVSDRQVLKGGTFKHLKINCLLKEKLLIHHWHICFYLWLIRNKYEKIKYELCWYGWWERERKREREIERDRERERERERLLFLLKVLLVSLLETNSTLLVCHWVHGLLWGVKHYLRPNDYSYWGQNEADAE